MAKSKAKAKSTAPAPQPVPAPVPASSPNSSSSSATAKRPGMFENAANWLLSRLPWFKDRYETWGKGKKIIIAFLLYLIILPVIPIVIALVMYLRDPQGFTKSKAFPILSAIIVAQLGLFGVIAVQPPQVTNPAAQSNGSTSSSSTKSDTTSTSATSKPTNGRNFDNCDAAKKAGVFDIPRSNPSYRAELDRDDDGVACER